jgi:DNA polymerase III epsilon subunit-like protein
VSLRSTRDVYISVDVETAGPNPSQYSLLSIGACTIQEPRSTFYVEFAPVNREMAPAAFAIHRLNLDRLAREGLPPAEALARFESWTLAQILPGQSPVFVAFNAPFDWMFVCDYFARFLGRNPFGHAALDIKALYMGLAGVPWSRTSMRFISRRYLGGRELTHHALDDAIDQARIFQELLSESSEQRDNKSGRATIQGEGS